MLDSLRDSAAHVAADGGSIEVEGATLIALIDAHDRADEERRRVARRLAEVRSQLVWAGDTMFYDLESRMEACDCADESPTGADCADCRDLGEMLEAWRRAVAAAKEG